MRIIIEGLRGIALLKEKILRRRCQNSFEDHLHKELTSCEKLQIKISNKITSWTKLTSLSAE
jgi:hypothetical protein